MFGCRVLTWCLLDFSRDFSGLNGVGIFVKAVV